MINETIMTILKSMPETPHDEVEEFGEVLHSVCLDIVEHTSVDINLYPIENIDKVKKLALYKYILKYACKLGFNSLLEEFDPLMFTVDNSDLVLCALSIADALIDTDDIDVEVPPRIMDAFMTYFSLVNGYPEADMESLTPLQSMYFAAWFGNGEVNDDAFDIGNIYDKILEAPSFETEDELNKALTIIKTLYGRVFLANPMDFVNWTCPDDNETGIHRLPATLLGRVYTIHVNQLIEANTDSSQIEAYQKGDLTGIDPILAATLSASMDETIESTLKNAPEGETRKLAEEIGILYNNVVDALLTGLKEYYLSMIPFPCEE